MGKLILLGGGKLLNERYDWLDTHIPQGSNALIIPGFSKKDETWINAVKTKLEKARVYSVIVLNHSQAEQTFSRINEFQIIFAAGGLPDKIMAALSKYSSQINEWFNRFDKIFIGMSAGALIASANVLITKDDDYPETRIIQGLGLFPDSIEVHYNGSSRSEIEKSGVHLVYCISEYAAIVVDSNHTEFVGAVTTITS